MNLTKRISNNHVLANCIGLIYLWFGVLKYFPEYSPAEDLATSTIDLLTFSLVPSHVSILLLAISETLIGLLLIMNIYRRQTVVLALTHMFFTFTPIFLFPDQIFTCLPFCFTLLGQYILKNVVIVGALITLYKSEKEE